MTLTTTHVALEGFVVWAAMGKQNRRIFREKRWLFTLLTLSAIIPDFDIFFYIHRTYLHSMVWPVIIILAALLWLAYRKGIRKVKLSEKEDLFLRSIILIGGFLILHIILDLDTGPVLLLYPFDSRMYSFRASIIVDLDFVLLFKGFQFDWSSVPLEQGIDVFFLNLSPAERISYFGTEFVTIFINEFPVHLLVLLGWFIFFPWLSFLSWIKSYEKPEKWFKNLASFKKPLLGIGLLLLTFGLILGPALKLKRIETQETYTTLSFSESDALYGVVNTYTLNKQDSVQLETLFKNNNSACNITSLITSQAAFTSYSSNIEAAFTDYVNESISYSELLAIYSNSTQYLLSEAIIANDLSYNQTGQIYYQTQQPRKIATIVILSDWNESVAFEVDITNKYTHEFYRKTQFYTGLGIAIAGGIVTSTSLILTQQTKHKEQEMEKEAEMQSETQDSTEIS
ncbi:MAG: metal-dependent hydrolase [Asgard group archaeon]|nr:metal-dependent hydrolase [Asgard group archaeon]